MIKVLQVLDVYGMDFNGEKNFAVMKTVIVLLYFFLSEFFSPNHGVWVLETGTHLLFIKAFQLSYTQIQSRTVYTTRRMIPPRLQNLQ